ncbi:MAG: bifunctional methylenetetrahydrofolate dehydrogenase/methenyltetrahydrofolate cyclohydrolase FolD [Rickettsiales bacterium]|nr:bifunctional methylenetetrahydrofolate dehydrogenase/methenyltetrahydrofolate cyclohydrolase FolD [Rickettsiales bacterium]|tara:strand:+ start:2748 stop:3629 length:882 start_codon:yes stop_codon:yes gene_type:complete
MRLLDGVVVKKEILADIKQECESLLKQYGVAPGLAVILVGDNPASQAYVGMKQKACESIGMLSFEHRLAASIAEEELVACIKQLNQDDRVHGILLQLPLPDHLNSDKMLQLIDPKKDVDGFHPENVGRLLVGLPTFKSCTPYGVLKLMEYYHIDPTGKHVVIIGRSNIVGKPLAAMLMQKGDNANATVTVCHSRSQNLAGIASQADILIAAIGKPYFVTPNMVKEGAIVIDVGINRMDDPGSDKGYKLVGDVDYDAILSKVNAITPVPGGVGPLTIAMLMSNTLQSFKNVMKA